MKVPCPQCVKPVFETAPACPNCGTHVYLEHPGDIPGVKHLPLKQPTGGMLAKAIDWLAAMTLVR